MPPPYLQGWILIISCIIIYYYSASQGKAHTAGMLNFAKWSKFFRHTYLQKMPDFRVWGYQSIPVSDLWKLPLHPLCHHQTCAVRKGEQQAQLDNTTQSAIPTERHKITCSLSQGRIFQLCNISTKIQPTTIGRIELTVDKIQARTQRRSGLSTK